MSLSRSEQARINGAKSRGPKTAAGKAISSRNGLKHGRYAKSASVISIEDDIAFIDLLQAYNAQFTPQTAVEARVVNEIAYIDWQLSRWRAIEIAQINRTYDLRNPGPYSINPSPDQIQVLTAALESSINESRFPAFISNRISRLLIERNNALRTLRTLRRAAPASSRQTDRLGSDDEIFVEPHSPQNPEATDSLATTYNQSSPENANRDRTHREPPE